MSNLYLDNAGSFPEYSKDILNWCRSGEKPASFSCNTETIRRLPLAVNQILSRIGAKTGWKEFPPETVPLLSGIHRYSQMLSIQGFGGLCDILDILKSAGIPLMLLKGLAFKAFYDKVQARLMNDFDVAVPENRFKEAVGLIRANGIKAESDCSPQHISIKADAKTIELHRWIFKNNVERGSDIWTQASETEFAGAQVLVPSSADMFIHQLDNRSRDLFLGVFEDRELSWLLDMETLLRQNPEILPKLGERAEELGVSFSTARMLARLQSVFPELVSMPPEIRETLHAESYKKWLESGESLRKAVPEFRRTGNRSFMKGIPTKAGFHLRQFRHLRLDYRQSGRNFRMADYFRYVYRHNG